MKLSESQITRLYSILFDNILKLRINLTRGNYIPDSIKNKLDFELAQLTNKIWDDIKVEFKLNE